jgi:putative transposase
MRLMILVRLMRVKRLMSLTILAPPPRKITPLSVYHMRAPCRPVLPPSSGTSIMSYKTPLLLATNAYFHVCNRGVNRQRIFFSDDDYVLFTKRIQASLSGIGIAVLNYCLMPNHFHFTLRQDEQYAMAVFFRRLCDGFAKLINLKYERTGHLFQGGYRPKLITNPNALLPLSRYIHRNPVAAGLVAKPRDWKYSSCGAYCGMAPTDFLDTETILRTAGGRHQYTIMLKDGSQETAEEVQEVLLTDY